MRCVQCCLVPLLASIVTRTHATTGDPRLASPAIVTDHHGNQADADSIITWGNGSTEGEPYKTDMTYDDGGLAPFYDMMHRFIGVVQPNDFPTELISDAMNDFSSITNDYMTLVMYGLGFAICMAIGVLFTMIAPIVGCCFCCCRTCCNKCGGKKLQKVTSSTRCKKITFSVLLFVCTAFILTGAGCMFATNDQMTVSLERFVPSVENNLEDMPIFINNTVDQFGAVASDGFAFTSDVLIRDLKSLGFLLGVPARDALKSQLSLDTVMDAIRNFETVIDDVGGQMDTVNNSAEQLKIDGKTLETDLADVVSDVTAAKAACGGCPPGLADTSQLVMDVNFDNLPDIEPQMLLLRGVQAQDLGAGVQDGRDDFEDIPWTVQNDTESMSNDIRSSIDDVMDDIDSAMSTLTDIKSQTADFVGSTEDDISSLFSPLADYDRFRWLGGLGLTCLVALIGVFQLVGLLCGGFGTITEPKPTERGCIATCGGNFLMSATGFIFIFSWLLMLLLTLLFLLGSNMYTLMCVPLTDPDMKFLELLEGENGIVKKDGYILSDLLFNDATIELPISGVLKSCRDNQAAMSALQLYRTFDIADSLDWRKHIDIGEEIDGIDVDFSGVTVLTPSVRKQLIDFKTAVQLDYQGFVDELSKDTTKADLATFSSELMTLHSHDNTAGFDAAAAKLNGIQVGIYNTVNTAQTQLLADVKRLNKSSQDVGPTVDNLIKSAEDVETYLQNNGSDVVKQEAHALKTRLERIIDSYVTYANHSMYHDIGKCRPFYNIYESMIDLSLCKYIVDSLNGFWFALGISMFFMMPSMIFNVKLAKHFRRMKFSHGLDDPSCPPAEKLPQPGSEPPPIFASNKVAPQWYF